MTTAPEISIVIPTFHRPELLRRAVTSCLRQQGMDRDRLEVVVVDNSPDASARDTIDSLNAAAAAGPVLRYVHEPQPGISRARNTGIQRSTGALIAFLDDDEEAGPDWVKTLRDCLIEFGGDVVLGPISFRFDTASSMELEFLHWCFDRAWPGKTGETVTNLVGTGNCMFRRDRCGSEAPFDPALSFTGGEDLRFFIELRGRGCRVVWCQEARVSEYCPPSRATMSYILRRSMRRGQLYVRGFTWRRPAAITRVAKEMAIGAGQLVILGPAGLLLWYIARTAARKCLVKAALGAGKLLWPSFLTLKGYGRA